MLKYEQKIKRDWDIVVFCIQQIRQMSKQLIPLYLIIATLDIISPFLSLYLTSTLLEELLGPKRWDVLISKALLLVLMQFAFNSVRHWSAQNQQYHKVDLSHKVDNSIAEKFSRIRFEAIENPTTRELYTKYRNYDMWYGGFPVLLDNLFGVITEIGSVIVSITIILRLLTLETFGNQAGILVFFTSPAATISILVILFLNVVVAFRENKIGSELALAYEEKMTQANKKFFYFAFELPNDYHFGKDIRLYNMADMINTELQNFFSASHKYRARYTEDLIKSETRNTTMTMFTYGVLYLYVVVKTVLGAISIGSIVLYTGAAANFGSGLNRLSSNLAQLHLCAQMLGPFQEIYRLPNSQSSPVVSAKEIPDLPFDIEFRDVSFCYPGTKHHVLSEVSFKMNPESHIALVGPNGSGKTTLIKLLCRLYEPSSGEILLNGTNIQEYDLEDYLQKIAVVFQDFQLFSFSVGQNVSAQRAFDTERTWSSLRQAGIEERVKKMPDELNTHLFSFTDDNGVELSGGEAQKIAIARALYRNAPLVILDEPTASLDPVSENEIYSHMNRMIHQKTAIFISHRLSSCRYCDEIVVLNQGRIVQQGNHEKLLNQKEGLYYVMWHTQAKQYEIEMYS